MPSGLGGKGGGVRCADWLSAAEPSVAAESRDGGSCFMSLLFVKVPWLKMGCR